MAIRPLMDRLFAERPPALLFHYTSICSLQGIIGEGGLWATDARYLNDAAELRHLMDLLQGQIDRRLDSGPGDREVLRQFRGWLGHRIPFGNMVFVASFTERGNLLSQWRAYSQPQKGISLGFEQDLVMRCAERQDYRVGRCIYDVGAQRQIATDLLDAVLSLCGERGPAPAHEKHPSQSYYSAFEAVENDLLTIGSLLKHPSFEEEKEWRAVSPVLSNYRDAPIKYRPGASMLIPYMVFSLTGVGDGAPRITHLYVGPTPHPSLAVESISRLLSKSQSQQRTIQTCGIPYRQL